MNKEKLKTKIFDAIGYASMCWSETPKGIFDSTKAGKIGNDLYKYIIENNLQEDELKCQDLIDKYNTEIKE